MATEEKTNRNTPASNRRDYRSENDDSRTNYGYNKDEFDDDDEELDIDDEPINKFESIFRAVEVLVDNLGVSRTRKKGFKYAIRALSAFVESYQQDQRDKRRSNYNGARNSTSGNRTKSSAGAAKTDNRSAANSKSVAGRTNGTGDKES